MLLTFEDMIFVHSDLLDYEKLTRIIIVKVSQCLSKFSKLGLGFLFFQNGSKMSLFVLLINVDHYGLLSVQKKNGFGIYITKIKENFLTFFAKMAKMVVISEILVILRNIF